MKYNIKLTSLIFFFVISLGGCASTDVAEFGTDMFAYAEENRKERNKRKASLPPGPVADDEINDDDLANGFINTLIRLLGKNKN